MVATLNRTPAMRLPGSHGTKSPDISACAHIYSTLFKVYHPCVQKQSDNGRPGARDATGTMVTDKPAPALNTTLSIIVACVIHNKITKSTLQYLISAQRQSVNLKTYSN